MKPLVIDMQAFGPFARRQVIDFRALGDKTFFLIHGPTGSGKTSILDAICFALFGDSSGGERDGRQMRSHHADGATLTEVRFDFSLGSERYRVRRVPEQMRNARRGGGATKHAQSAEISRLQAGADVEQPLASGWSKVTEAVVGLLGFESQQFRQVIMLPQGKFFEFLKSNSQEREKILQTLFGTELYKRIEEQLKFAANEIADQSHDNRKQRQTLLDQARCENETELDARAQQQGVALDARRSAEQSSAAAAQVAERTLTESRRVAGRFDELDQANAALLALRAQEPASNTQRSRLAGARRAASIQPYAAALAELGRQFDDEAQRCKALAAELVSATGLHDQASAALERERQRAPQAERAIERSAELDALVDKVVALTKARAACAAGNAEATRLGAALAGAQQIQNAAAGAAQTLMVELQEQRLHAAGLDGLRQTQARLTTQLTQSSTLAACMAELAEAAKHADARRAAMQSAAAACAGARTRRDELRLAWIASQAARLAHELVDGRPCPVCGAHEHPAPAHSAGALVLDATLQAAEDALTQAEQAQRDAQQKQADDQRAAGVLEARIAALRTTLGDAPASNEQMKDQAGTAQARLKRAEAAAKVLEVLQARLAATALAAQNAEATTRLAQAALQQAQASLQQMAGQLAEREAAVPADLRDPAALQAARAAALDLKVSLKRDFDAATHAANIAAARLNEARARLHAGEQALARLAAQQKDKAEDLEQRLLVAGFASRAEYQAARLDEAAMDSLEASLRTFDAALAAGVERQARAAEGTRDLVRPDLAIVIAGHEGAKTAQLAASNAVRDALAALATTTSFTESLKRLAAQFQTIEVRYTVLKQVAEVASGANSQRMSFQRYVLASLLEEVLAATTLRLRVMSRSRYEMRRKLQPGDQRAHAGLDLEVFDQYTGTTRAVGTLSGGESFLASLALALGLSDVVQSYAGGIRLDAIFVDEGFGSLDPEALEFAIRALKDLQQAGRMVGIISHVAELKELIDARLELKATQTGSVAEFVL
ncbi:MAG: SMC family ATPase [Burkholderiaceae bacterium]